MNLKKVAKEAGVSLSTASKAINNSFDVSEETRKRVLKIAEKNGYFMQRKKISVENKKAKNLKIAIICPEIISTYYSQIVFEFVKAAEENKCSCVIYNSGFDYEKVLNVLNECVNDLKTDAVICISHIDNLENGVNIPVVVLTESRAFSGVTTDLTAVIGEAVEYLKEKYGSVCFLGEKNTDKKNVDFLNYTKKFEPGSFDIIVSKMRFEEAGRECARKVMKNGKTHRAYLCAYDEIALGFIDEMKKNGYSVPDDIAVMGINDISSADYCFGGLTTIRFEYADVYRRIIDDILKDSESKNVKKRHYHVKTRIIKRYTA